MCIRVHKGHPSVLKMSDNFLLLRDKRLKEPEEQHFIYQGAVRSRDFKTEDAAPNTVEQQL